jgi:O-antigen/teichoic acid export membrane protein
MAVAFETGLFSTSSRVLEILYGVSSLAVGVALPVFAVASSERARLAYMLQRAVEVSAIVGCYLTVMVLIMAVPILTWIGGRAYAEAAPVLRVQVFALLPVFVGATLQLVLIAIRRQSAQAIANLVGLVVLLAAAVVLIPPYHATGAAIAAVVAEASLTLALLRALAVSDRALLPHPGFLWKLGLASAAAVAPIFVSALPDLLRALLATAAYLAVLIITRAVPPEVWDAFVHFGGVPDS